MINKKQFLTWLCCLILGLALGFGYPSIILKDISRSPLLSTQPLATQSPTPSPTPTPSPVTLIFTGDVMLGRSVNKNIVVNKDPTWPFKNVASILSSADITYINLENPLVSNCPILESGFKFCGNLDNVKGLQYAGVDIASLANNHSTNYGESGLAQTIEVLESNGITPVGVGGPVKLTKNGQVFTFMSFNDIGPYPLIDNVDTKTLQAEIRSAKDKKEVLITTFHWGPEYRSFPSERQVMLAHLAVDAGADLVIGAHPHWVQTKEIYKDKVIYYSLGNFVFDQEWSQETKKGLVVRFTYDAQMLVNTEEIPVLIENYGQPRWLSP